MKWQEYVDKFPCPFDISDPWAWRDDPQYDEKRKANLRWQAEYYTKGYADEAPSNFALINPFLNGNGGWYYGRNGAEWIPPSKPQPKVDWAAEKAAGRPVIGPY